MIPQVIIPLDEYNRLTLIEKSIQERERVAAVNLFNRLMQDLFQQRLTGQPPEGKPEIVFTMSFHEYRRHYFNTI